MQQAVGQFGAGHLHVIGELEAPLEGALGDAAMQVDRGVLTLLRGLAALHDRHAQIGDGLAHHRPAQQDPVRRADQPAAMLDQVSDRRPDQHPQIGLPRHRPP